MALGPPTTFLHRAAVLFGLVIAVAWPCNNPEAARLFPLHPATIHHAVLPVLNPARSVEAYEVPLLNFYHSTPKLVGAIKRICAAHKDRCQFEMLSGTDQGERSTGNRRRIVKTPVVRIVPAGKHGPPTKASGLQKVFALFGEHARELISPESGLALIELILTGQAGEAA